MTRRILLSLALIGLCFWQPIRGAETRQDRSLNAVTTGTSIVYSISQYDRIGLSVIWASGVTAGEVVLETSPTNNSAATWSEAISLNVTAAPTPPSISAESIDIAGTFARVRVSTTVSGGGTPSATAYITMQNTAR